VVDFEAREAMNLKTFDWPAQSPDLNEIERCWDYEKVGLSSLACCSRLGAFWRAPAHSSGSLGYKILVWRSLKGTTKVHYVV
jgi:hypothetical protein